MKYTYGSHKVTVNEKAKLEIMDRLNWWGYDENSELDEATQQRIAHHIERVMNALDTNGNLRNKIWGE